MLHTSFEEPLAIPLVFSPGPTCDSEPRDKGRDKPRRGEKDKPRKQPDTRPSREGGVSPPVGTDRLERPAFPPIDSESAKSPAR
jgi:hypothetical protein